MLNGVGSLRGDVARHLAVKAFKFADKKFTTPFFAKIRDKKKCFYLRLQKRNRIVHDNTRFFVRKLVMLILLDFLKNFSKFWY